MVKNVETVNAAERALSILLAFGPGDRRLTLVELARRTELDKSTVLRLARTLAARGFLMANDDASWRLGPALVRLGRIYQETLAPGEIMMPALERLARETGESAAVYVREGDQRICLFRHESAQSIRHAISVGSMLPLHLGAPGRVILAFEGETGEIYDAIRDRGYHLSFGERDTQVASMAFPLFGLGDGVFGSIAVTGPPNRFTHAALVVQRAELILAARTISAALGASEAARALYARAVPLPPADELQPPRPQTP